MLHVSFNINMYIFLHFFIYIVVVCLIGCHCLQHSKKPWCYTTKAIEKLDNKDKRSYFINNLDTFYEKHKYDSEKLYLELTNLIVDYAKNKL